jgi:hypothetical protein
LGTVVPDAVVEDQLHVVDELLQTVVDVEKQLLFYCPQIHRLGYYIEVIGYTVFTEIDGLLEVMGLL